MCAESLYGFPATYLPRGVLLQSWDGRLEGGRIAPAGTYKLVMRALRIFGDPEVADDYDVKETVEFNLRYK